MVASVASCMGRDDTPDSLCHPSHRVGRWHRPGAWCLDTPAPVVHKCHTVSGPAGVRCPWLDPRGRDGPGRGAGAFIHHRTAEYEGRAPTERRPGPVPPASHPAGTRIIIILAVAARSGRSTPAWPEPDRRKEGQVSQTTCPPSETQSMDTLRSTVGALAAWVRRPMPWLQATLARGPANEEDPEGGQGLAEYALILALIAIAVIGALAFFGERVSSGCSQGRSAQASSVRRPELP